MGEIRRRFGGGRGGIPLGAGELLEEVVDLEAVCAVRLGPFYLPAVLYAGEADVLAFAEEIDAADGSGFDGKQALIAEVAESLVEAGLDVGSCAEDARIAGHGGVDSVTGGRVVAEEKAGGFVAFGGDVEFEGRVGEAKAGEVRGSIFDDALGGKRREVRKHAGDGGAVSGISAGGGDPPLVGAGAEQRDRLRAFRFDGERSDGGGIDFEDVGTGVGGGSGGVRGLAVIGPVKDTGEDEEDDRCDEETAKFHRASF